MWQSVALRYFTLQGEKTGVEELNITTHARSMLFSCIVGQVNDTIVSEEWIITSLMRQTIRVTALLW